MKHEDADMTEQNGWISSNISLAVSTGALWPMSTVDGLRALQELALYDIELTLQQHEFLLSFDQQLRIPIWEDLQTMIAAQQLRVRSVHAVNMGTEHGYSQAIRAAYLRHMIQRCHQLGGQIVVVHPFHLCTDYESTLAYLRGEVSSVQEILLPGLTRILDDAHTTQIVVAVENVKLWHDDETNFFNAPKNVRRFLEEIAHPSLKLTLDMMHAHLIGFQKKFLDMLGPHIVNVHVADVLPPARRVPLGKGHLDWQALIPQLQSLPNVRQITVELAGANAHDLLTSVQFFAQAWKQGTTVSSAYPP